MSKLKPCPFCGGEAKAAYGRCDYNVWQVCCLNNACQAMAGWCDTKDDAIAAWNRRAGDKPTPPAWQRTLYRKFTHGRELE